MVDGSESVMVIDVWPFLVVSFREIVVLEDATDTAHSKFGRNLPFRIIFDNVDHATSAKVVNVVGDPASIVEVTEIVAGFMISAHKYSQDRSTNLFLIESMELPHLSVLRWTLQSLQILLISDTLHPISIKPRLYIYLEISTANDEGNFLSTLLFPILQFLI